MRYAVIDTETTGLMDFKLPADAEGQPRVAQIGMILIEDIDAPPVVQGFYIKPDGWVMGAEAGAVNGLTDAFLEEHGVPVAEALDAYVAAVEAGYVMVAFNAQFDLKMMRAELRRAGRDDLFDRTPNICVMRAATDIVRQPAKNGRSGFKFPKLSEACMHFGIENARQHDALGDAHAALAILRALDAIGALPEAKVHFAKQKPEPASVAIDELTCQTSGEKN